MFWLVLTLLVETGAGAPTEELVAIEPGMLTGYYEQLAQHCVRSQSGDCADTATDRMVLAWVDDSQARVVVHSHQGHGHECHVDGIAQLTPQGLRYCPELDPGTCLTLTQDRTSIHLKVTLEGPYHVPFCGSRASLDGLRFAKSALINPRHCRTQE